MKAKILELMTRFESICDNWRQTPDRIEKYADFAYIWHPETSRGPIEKRIGLLLQVVTHGNEVGGIETLLELLNLLHLGILRPNFTIGFVFGNPLAARENQRFLHSDLNRSFGRSEVLTTEEKRARLLEPLLDQARLFVDFHQTIEPTQQAFFIFPYSAKVLQMAAAMHTELPIITHWGTSFSKDGKCTDEYVNSKGGIGLTVELGQKGFNSYQSALGLQLAIAAIQYGVALDLPLQGKPSLQSRDGIYTWKAVVPFEDGMQLRAGLVNFQFLTFGEPIGSFGDKIITSAAEGWLLFPKYTRDTLASKPKELYRILKQVRLDELGLEGVVNK